MLLFVDTSREFADQCGNGGAAMKAGSHMSQRAAGGGAAVAVVSRSEAASQLKQSLESEFGAIRASVWERGDKVRLYVKDTTQRGQGARDRGFIDFGADGSISTSNYRGFVGGGELVSNFKQKIKIKTD
jgi:hypothetical protein